MTHAEIRQAIQAMGYTILNCIDNKAVLIVRRNRRGNGFHKFGYHFDSLEEAHEYFTSK